MTFTPQQLQTYLHHLVRDGIFLSTMIWGPPGIGKSSIVAQVAQQTGLAFIDVRLSQLAHFRAVEDTWTREREALCVYLTDGYGDFPETTPELPVLWVVVPGGLEDEEFPYGEVVRLRGT